MGFPVSAAYVADWWRSASLASVADPFQIVGTSLEGKYRIDSMVGEGGFGVVYRGYHLSFEHAIAIKCLKVPPHFTPEARELFLSKFREEGKHLSRLGEHPSITRVYDFGIVGSAVPIPYLVLEWLDGDDLEQLLAKRRAKGEVFSEIEALQLLRPAIDALSMAHGLGIAHRDIKPPNLYWAKGVRGRVLKVLDFGIAKAMAEGDTATQIATKTSSGFSAFSPSYGAPEQFRAKKFGATGPWTDVHAIGLMLAEMVAGRAAFEGDEMIEFYEQCAKETRPTPRVLGAEVSDAFEALCQKALALSPKDRFASASALLAAVDRLLEGAPPLVLDDARPAEKKATTPVAASEPNATVAQAPLEIASTSSAVGTRPKKSKNAATVAAEPLAAPRESSGTVLAEPVEVGRAPKTARPDPTSPARLALGAGAVIAVLGVVYVATRGPSSDAPASSTATAQPIAASVPTGAPPAPTASESQDPLAAPADVTAPPADATRTASGLAYKRLKRGTGTEHPAANDDVSVRYMGWTTDGRMFDSSAQTIARGSGVPLAHATHASIRLAVDGEMPGWTEGLQLMVVEEKMRFWIPADLAYGENRDGDKPRGMLVFDIELKGIYPRKPATGTGSASAAAARGASPRPPPAVDDPYARESPPPTTAALKCAHVGKQCERAEDGTCGHPSAKTPFNFSWDPCCPAPCVADQNCVCRDKK